MCFPFHIFECTRAKQCVWKSFEINMYFIVWQTSLLSATLYLTRDLTLYDKPLRNWPWFICFLLNGMWLNIANLSLNGQSLLILLFFCQLIDTWHSERHSPLPMCNIFQIMKDQRSFLQIIKIFPEDKRSMAVTDDK